MKDIIYHSDQLIVSWFLKLIQNLVKHILIIFSDTYTCTYIQVEYSAVSHHERR